MPWGRGDTLQSKRTEENEWEGDIHICVMKVRSPFAPPLWFGASCCNCLSASVSLSGKSQQVCCEDEITRVKCVDNCEGFSNGLVLSPSSSPSSSSPAQYCCPDGRFPWGEGHGSSCLDSILQITFLPVWFSLMLPVLPVALYFQTEEHLVMEASQWVH